MTALVSLKASHAVPINLGISIIFSVFVLNTTLGGKGTCYHFHLTDEDLELFSYLPKVT